jgi:putative ATP-dependent endonuclease of OLD family
MYLSKVSVWNFRNLKELHLSLSPGLNVIVGENNVGKTNLLDAIRAGLGAASATGDAVRITKDDLHMDPSGTITSEPIRVELVFAGLRESERAQCIEILNYDASDPDRSTASIHFHWSWDDKVRRWSVQRWAGDRPDAEAAVPDEILQSIPLTLLTAMRDALSALMPGRQSRLGRLLAATAAEKDRSDLEDIVRSANLELQKTELVTRVEERIGSILMGTSGPALSQNAAVQTSEPKFDRIVNSLRLVLKMHDPSRAGETIGLRELQLNGLGYNNLLYIATVLAELAVAPETLLPLLLVEEPEAHLHPQLQTLLADFLASANGTKSGGNTQTIVTTHSPTIAAHVPPTSIRVMHYGNMGMLRCTELGQCGLTDRESNQLQRLLDVTKATLLFSKGVILVEGITEALLLPVFARRLGVSLEQNAVSIVPVYGVDFATLAKLFGEARLELPLSIVTDGDPEVDDLPGQGEIPKGYPAAVEPCARVTKLKALESASTLIRVFNSLVTLECDIALAAVANADTMCSVWESLYERTPSTFNATLLHECGEDLAQRALLTWRGICLSSATRSKAEFAQALASALDEQREGKYVITPDRFVIPEYLQAAIKHVTLTLNNATPNTGTTAGAGQ